MGYQRRVHGGDRDRVGDMCLDGDRDRDIERINLPSLLYSFFFKGISCLSLPLVRKRFLHVFERYLHHLAACHSASTSSLEKGKGKGKGKETRRGEGKGQGKGEGKGKEKGEEKRKETTATTSKVFRHERDGKQEDNDRIDLSSLV